MPRTNGCKVRTWQQVSKIKRERMTKYLHTPIIYIIIRNIRRTVIKTTKSICWSKQCISVVKNGERTILGTDWISNLKCKRLCSFLLYKREKENELNVPTAKSYRKTSISS
jgi:hypothetical protein